MPSPELKITILGSGTCVPSLKRSSCSVLVETGSQKILMDAGPGTMRRLLESGNEIFDITYMIFSHFHPDHISELVPFIFANKYPNSARRKKPLTLIGGKGFINFFNGLKNVFGEWIELSPGLINILELDNKKHCTMNFHQFCLESIPVKHRPESIAIKIKSLQNYSIVYSGDTDFSENLISLASDANLLICESAVPDNQKVPGHLTPSLAGKIATQARVPFLVLTHFYPECDLVDIKKQCRNTYDGRLVLGEDLLFFELP
ncbi:MAG: MBL fold metallo-hydrolase [Desulfobacterales bacterium]